MDSWDYCRSGNFRVASFRVLIFRVKYFDGIKLNRFYVPRFGDLERDYARQENMEYEQFAAFVATTQLFANYSRAKEN